MVTQGSHDINIGVRCWRFAGEFLISIGLSVLPWLIVQSLVASGNVTVALFLFIFVLKGTFWALYYIPAVIVLCGGIFLRRWGVIAGPGLLLGGFILAILGVQLHHKAAISAFAPPAIKEPANPHAILAIDGTLLPDEKDELGAWCQVLCMRVVATSPYAFAQRDDSGHWRVFQRAQ